MAPHAGGPRRGLVEMCARPTIGTTRTSLTRTEMQSADAGMGIRISAAVSQSADGTAAACIHTVCALVTNAITAAVSAMCTPETVDACSAPDVDGTTSSEAWSTGWIAIAALRTEKKLLCVPEQVIRSAATVATTSVRVTM